MTYVPKALQAPRAPLSVHGNKNILAGKHLRLSITLYSKLFFGGKTALTLYNPI